MLIVLAGLPGVDKTTFAKCLAATLGASMHGPALSRKASILRRNATVINQTEGRGGDSSCDALGR